MYKNKIIGLSDFQRGQIVIACIEDAAAIQEKERKTSSSKQNSRRKPKLFETDREDLLRKRRKFTKSRYSKLHKGLSFN